MKSIYVTIIYLCLSTCIWIIIHFLAVPAGVLLISSLPSRYSSLFNLPSASSQNFWSVSFLSCQSGMSKIYNFRRLVRSTLFCLFASSYGLFLLFSPTTWPEGVLLRFTPTYRLIFSAVCTHWALSIVEDHMVGNEIYTTSSSQQNNSLFAFFYGGLLSHHIFAIFAYGWCLCTEKLSGMCMFGLLFEIPVILLNVRDIYIIYFCPHESLWNQREVHRFWIILHILWHITRTLACLLYISSLFIWINDIKSLLGHRSFIVYNVLGCGFTYINCVLLCTVIPMYVMSDIKRTQTSLNS